MEILKKFELSRRTKGGKYQRLCMRWNGGIKKLRSELFFELETLDLKLLNDLDYKNMFSILMRSFVRLAQIRLSSKQKLLLKKASNLLSSRKMTLTSLAEHLSSTEDLPHSTVKWNLRALRDVGLLMGGDMNEKGIDAELTLAGALLAESLD
jgi:DNA-binding transcriptional ArsR family regulator